MRLLQPESALIYYPIKRRPSLLSVHRPSPAGITLILCALVVSIQAKTRIRCAVFSDRQDFRPAASDSIAVGSKISIGVLPVNTSAYTESMPCDSCHRLSPDGVHFALENWLLHTSAEFTGHKTELAAPHHDLVKKYGFNLLDTADSLAFPFGAWLGENEEALIYRPSDKFTSAAVKQVFNRLGGGLGYTHLLIPVNFKMHVTPKSKHEHKGGLEYTFSLVFWDVARAAPEWALQYEYEKKKGDLDQALEEHWDKDLLPYFRELPKKVEKLKRAEPK